MRRTLALLVLVPAAIACEQIIGANFTVERVECKHVTPPPPPGMLGGGSQDFVEAVHGVSFGEADGGFKTIGYDGDNTCTLLGEGPSCALAKWVEAGISPDGVDGRDNGIGWLVAGQQEGFGSAPFSSAKITDEIDKGLGPAAAIFAVHGYNGFTGDSDVQVEMYLPANPVADAGAPAWDMTPTLDVTSDSANVEDGGAVPKWHATQAYVSNYQLVAQFEEVAFRISTTAFPMRRAVLTADVGKQIGRLTNAQLWGVVRMTEMFNLFPDFTKYVTRAAICKSSPLYKVVKEFYCRFPDIRVDGQTDPNLPCDGLSFGVALDTRPAKIGSVVIEQRPVYCTGNDDPKGDTCENP